MAFLCLSALLTVVLLATSVGAEVRGKLYPSSDASQWLVELQVGYPIRRVQMVVDTSSYGLWMTCSAEDQKSRGFKKVPCAGKPCSWNPLPENSVCKLPGDQVCDFKRTYGNSPFSAEGILAQDLFFMGATVTETVDNELGGLVFGCATKSRSPEGISGILGLDRGPLSLPAQTTNRFSYCIPDFMSENATGELVMEYLSKPDFPSLTVTPIVGNFSDNYVGVEGFSVDGVRVQGIDPKVWELQVVDQTQAVGGSLFSTSTTLMLLLEPAYSKITAALSNAIKLPRTPVQPLDFCYKATKSAIMSLPMVGIHFQGGATMSLLPSNYMVNQEEGVFCIAMADSKTFGADKNIFGSLIQRNFHMQYNYTNVGFAWSPCS